MFPHGGRDMKETYLDLAIEIANMKQEDCTARNIQNLIARHRMWVSQAGYEAGYETYWWDKNEKGEELSLLFYTPQPGSLFGKVREMQRPGCGYIVLCPGDDNYEATLWEAVSSVQKTIRALFDNFISGLPDIEMLQTLCKQMSLQPFFEKTNNPWIPQIVAPVDRSTATKLILSREIVIPFIHGIGENFQRIRCCPECGDYFYAKDIRKTYCEEKCRNSYNNRMANSVAETTRNALSKMNKK